MEGRVSKFWRERANPKKHVDFMSFRNEGGVSIKKPVSNLISQWIYFIEFEGAVFQFVNLDQVNEFKEYFKLKVHPSTRELWANSEHYWHPWYCRLPKGIKRNVKRFKLLKLIDQALSCWRIE